MVRPGRPFVFGKSLKRNIGAEMANNGSPTMQLYDFNNGWLNSGSGGSSIDANYYATIGIYDKWSPEYTCWTPFGGVESAVQRHLNTPSIFSIDTHAGYELFTQNNGSTGSGLVGNASSMPVYGQNMGWGDAWPALSSPQLQRAHPQQQQLSHTHNSFDMSPVMNNVPLPIGTPSIGTPSSTTGTLSFKSMTGKRVGPKSVTSSESVEEVFSRKVFVGGLPIDVTDAEIRRTFSRYGPVLVDWPRRTDGRDARQHMSGYVFLVFDDERAVQRLHQDCLHDDGRQFIFVSSPTMRNKPVQVRPWKLSDMDYKPYPDMPIDPRRTVFIGGVPRPTRASELAKVLDELYGGVCYVGIDIDPELKYPKGAARVTFDNTESFIRAIAGRFVQIPHADTAKRVEIKPYVMDEQMCDHCYGKKCLDRYASYFCGDPSCLQYYCEVCWDAKHYGPEANPKRSAHKPLVRTGDQTKLCLAPPHHARQPLMVPSTNTSFFYTMNNLGGGRRYGRL